MGLGSRNVRGPQFDNPRMSPRGEVYLNQGVVFQPSSGTLLPHHSQKNQLQNLRFKGRSTSIAMALIKPHPEVVIRLNSLILPVFWIPFVVIIIFLRYFIRREISPLRNIPGPFLASISRGWKGAFRQT
jgi:hypothetical protein